MRLLVVDDHVLLREGLVSLLEGQPDFAVVGQASSVEEAILLAQEMDPDLILMDLGLPDGTGLDATRAILADRPEARIVILTVHEDDELLFDALRAGAKGYLLKNVPTTKLVAYLKGIERGEAALTPTMTSRVLDEFARTQRPAPAQAPELDVLTAREREVLALIDTGASNQEIGDKLVIAENTVKNHVHNILTKLDLKDRQQLALYHRQATGQG